MLTYWFWKFAKMKFLKIDCLSFAINGGVENCEVSIWEPASHNILPIKTRIIWILGELGEINHKGFAALGVRLIIFHDELWLSALTTEAIVERKVNLSSTWKNWITLL